MLELCPCPPHMILYCAATGATRFATATVELDEIPLTPSACAIRNA